MQLDPRLAEPYGVLGTFAQTRGEWREAHLLFREGVARNDRNPVAHFWLADHLVQIGYINESVVHLQRAMEFDPLVRAPWADVAWIHLMFGDPEVALQQFDKLWNGGLQSMEVWVGRYWTLVGLDRLDDALHWLDRSPFPDHMVDWHRIFIDELANGDGDPAFVDEIIAWERSGLDHRDSVQMASSLEHFDRTFDMVRWRSERNRWVDMMVLWGLGTEIRSQPGFPAALTAIGMIEFWDEFGWGDVCRRDGSDIECDARNVDFALLPQPELHD